MPTRAGVRRESVTAAESRRRRRSLFSSESPSTENSTVLVSRVTLSDHTHWLCDRGSAEPAPHNNTAAYGACVATVYARLQLQGLPDRETPGYAGVPLELAVLKLDHYGQTITTDSSSSLQVYTALAGDQINDNSVSFLGTIFSVFDKGRAAFTLGVRPTFATVSALDGFTELQRPPFLYVQGTDAATGAVMETVPPQQVHLASRNNTVCPVGWVLLLDQSTGSNTLDTDGANVDGRPGACTPCGFGTYSLDPLLGICRRCPASATCMNGRAPLFNAVKVTGELELELPDGSTGETIKQALALELGVDMLLIVLPDQARRASVQKITYEIVGSSEEIAAIAQDLASKGVVVESEEVGQQIPEGEQWLREPDGSYKLSKCPQGFLLVNTTGTCRALQLCTRSRVQRLIVLLFR